MGPAGECFPLVEQYLFILADAECLLLSAGTFGLVAARRGFVWPGTATGTGTYDGSCSGGNSNSCARRTSCYSSDAAATSYDIGHDSTRACAPTTSSIPTCASKRGSSGATTLQQSADASFGCTGSWFDRHARAFAVCSATRSSRTTSSSRAACAKYSCSETQGKPAYPNLNAGTGKRGI